MLFDVDVDTCAVHESVGALTHLAKILTADLLKQPLFHFRVEYVLNWVEGLVHDSVEVMSPIELTLFVNAVSACVLKRASSNVHVFIRSESCLFR